MIRPKDCLLLSDPASQLTHVRSAGDKRSVVWRSSVVTKDNKLRVVGDSDQLLQLRAS
jgi:hypothetical protein